jgi:hypothetical protein
MLTACPNKQGALMRILHWRMSDLIADRSVIGKVLSVDREPYEVIGVMNAEFEPRFFPASQ